MGRRLASAITMALAAAPTLAQPVPTVERQAVLVALLRQDCGSCHGLRLTGGLGPPLTRDVLAGKSEASMVATILAGRRGTPMPPWAPFMSESEARWLVDVLRTGGIDAR